jgi:hypothetical protein
MIINDDNAKKQTPAIARILERELFDRNKVNLITMLVGYMQKPHAPVAKSTLDMNPRMRMEDQHYDHQR